MKKLLLLFTFFALQSSAYPQELNEPDPMLNLALSNDATLSGSVVDGRGKPLDILYNPEKENYEASSSFAEYGVNFREVLTDTFYWQVDWTSPKLVNYITFAGTYPNQPQPNTPWKISYLYKGNWLLIAQGTGGWIDSGIFEYKTEDLQPITVEAIKVEVFPDCGAGCNVESIHLRGRGGSSDSATETKATLIQLLPYEVKEPSVTIQQVYDILINVQGNHTRLRNDVAELRVQVANQAHQIKKLEDLVNTKSNIASKELEKHQATIDTLMKSNYSFIEKLGSLSVVNIFQDKKIDLLASRGAQDVTELLTDLKEGVALGYDCDKVNTNYVYIGDLDTKGKVIVLYNANLWVFGDIKGTVTKACKNSRINGK